MNLAPTDQLGKLRVSRKLAPALIVRGLRNNGAIASLTLEFPEVPPALVSKLGARADSRRMKAQSRNLLRH
jgi:hypothetical protein